MILDIATKNPAALAVDDLSRQRSWAELVDRSTRVARFLREGLGIQPDQHVAVLMRNRVEFLELILGAVLAGVWITPINRHLSLDEIAYIVEDSAARALFCEPELREIAAKAGARNPIWVGDELDSALAQASDAPLPLDGPAGATMIYTSGTTGKPKGVKRARPPNVAEALQAHASFGRRIGLDGSGPHLLTGPMYHAAPLLFAVYDQANGAPIIIMPEWDDRHALELLADRKIAHTHMVPTMFVRLLRLPEEIRANLGAPALRLVLHGAAPVSVSVKQQMIEWLGEILVEYWGATEGGVTTLVNSRDWLAHPGTVGKALADFEIFAVDENGGRLPDGETGMLYCRHRRLKHVFEYHRNPEKTAGTHLEAGVFTVGDVGRVDSDGYVYLVDRESNLIISGGVNIYPAEIEQVLREHPAVADIGVFGIPNEEWGETVKAAVELNDGYQASSELEAEILNFGRARLARYKLPRSLDFEAELPRHPSGKLHIRRLRDRYWRSQDRKI